MKKIYAVYECVNNGEYEGPDYNLVSVHETEDGAEKKKEILDKKLSSFMRDWGYSYYIQEYPLEA